MIHKIIRPPLIPLTNWRTASEANNLSLIINVTLSSVTKKFSCRKLWEKSRFSSLEFSFFGRFSPFYDSTLQPRCFKIDTNPDLANNHLSVKFQLYYTKTPACIVFTSYFWEVLTFFMTQPLVQFSPKSIPT